MEARLAACANIEPPIRSVWRWPSAIGEGEDTPLILKTRAALFAGAEALVHRHHPKQTPAIPGLPVIHATADFTRWLAAETNAAT